MPVGANEGGQLNIAVFEVGVVNAHELFGVPIELVHTMTIHPLLVAPTRWAYNDRSRMGVVESVGGSGTTAGGRALRQVTLEGTFGEETRGLALYIGNGAIRFKRFYNEVVRMGEAITDDDLEDAIDSLSATPLIRLLTSHFDEDVSIAFINFYDFWHDRAFQARIQTFDHVREHRRGGAQGLTHYTMRIQELGPRVEGGIGGSFVAGLMAGLTLWNDLNDVLESYTLTAIIGSFTGLVAIAASELADTMRAVQAQIDAVQSLMGGHTSTPGSATTAGTPATTYDGLAGFFAAVRNLEEQADALADVMGLEVAGEASGDRGAPDLGSGGGNDSLDRQEGLAETRNLAVQARRLAIMGAFFGMSEDEYQSYVESEGSGDRTSPEVEGTTTHIVTDTDTPDRIENRYRIEWWRILALNNLLPDEALLVGSELQIPSTRPRGPQPIDGLPVYDSHVGRSAWGKDVTPGMDVGADGDLVIVEGEDCLVQGANVLLDLLAGDLLQAVNALPSTVRTQYLARRLSDIFATDQRVKAVQDITVDIAPDGSISVDVALKAINGGIVRTGVSA